MLFRFIFFAFISLYSIVSAQNHKMQLPRGHQAEVYQSDTSSDGKYIVTSSADKTAKVWEARTGYLLFSLERHTKQVSFVKFANNNTNIITGGDNSIIVWDLLAGKLIHQMKHGKTPDIDYNNLSGQTIYFTSITAIDINKESTLIASGALDSLVNIWQLKTGKKLFDLKHPGKIISASFFKDGRYLLTASENHFVGIWDCKSGKLVKQIIPEAKNINSIKISPDESKILLHTNTNGSIQIWDIKTGQLIHHLSREERLMSANWSADGSRIIGSANKKTMIWDATSGNIAHEMSAQTGWVDGGIYSPSGKFIATRSRDLSINVWRASDNTLLHVFKGHMGFISNIQFSPDENYLISCSHDHSAKIWDLQTGVMHKSLSGAEYEAYFGIMSKNGHYFLSASANKACNLWDLKSAKIIHPLIGHNSWVSFADFSEDYKWIITSSADHTAKMWHLETGKIKHTLVGHSDLVNHVCFNKNATQAVTASEDKTAIVWDLISGTSLHVLKHTGQVKTVAFSPDGKQILTTSFDKTAKIWDAETGQELTVLNKHKWVVRAGKYSLDGKYIVTASGDKTAIIWDGKTGNHLRTFEGHTDFVYQATLSHDNKLLYTASTDNTLKIWQSDNGLLLHTIPLNGASVKSIVVSKDKTFFITYKQGIFQITDLDLNTKCSVFLKDDLCMMFTPDGAYMGDKAMVKLLYYLDGIKTLGFDQLDVKNNRPDLVLKALGETVGHADHLLINSYQRAWQKRMKKLGIEPSTFDEGFSLPESDIKNRDAITYDQNNNQLDLVITAKDNQHFIDRYNVWVNEVPVFGQNGINILKKKLKKIEESIKLTLSDGINKIEVSVLNEKGVESYRLPLYVKYTPIKPTVETLYFVGIGLDKHLQQGYDLKYSTKDIRDLVDELKIKYNNKIVIDTLFNENVTRKNITELKEKLLKTSVNDKVILSFSGHGLLDKNLDYFLATYQVNFDNPAENGLPYEDIEWLFDKIPARKKLLLLDACHSGEIDKEDLIIMETTLPKDTKGSIVVAKSEKKIGIKNSFELMQDIFSNVNRGTGTTIISAAAGTEFAFEKGHLKNGVFTFSILELMKQLDEMKLSELKIAVGKRVSELTNGLQKPTSRNEILAFDWRMW